MKAILELDMPDKCLQCILSDHEVDDETEYLYCHAINESVDEVGFMRRHDKCPLKVVQS